MSDTPRVVELADGSISCIDATTGELYHNKAGAIAEALNNFVLPLGLPKMCEESQSRDGRLSVLDLPFGLGYNSFVFLNQLLSLDTPQVKVIEITAVENDDSILPLVHKILSTPHLDLLSEALGKRKSTFIKAIESFSPLAIELNTRSGVCELRFHLIRADMRKLVPQLVLTGHKFDAVMHDPFSANKMPELWTLDLFMLYRQMLYPNGRLTTYSVAAAVRSGLRNSGLHVYGTSPVGLKSGGTLATVEPLEALDDCIFALTADDTARLVGKTGVPYRDLSFSSTAAEIKKRRLQEQEALSTLQ